MPLAIELAAATHGSMPLAELSRRLDERFRLLTGGNGNALGRQQTLGVTIAWSYDLLTDAERGVFRRLSVFVDGFDVEGAQAVCASELAKASDIAEILRTLVDSSLVVVEPVSGTMWYSMLEVIRQFAAERLVEEDGGAAASAARQRHADYALGLCEQAAPHLLGGDAQIEWMHRLDREWGNLQGALSYFEMASDGVASIVVLASSLGIFGLTREHREPYAALTSVLDRTRDESSELRGQALVAWARYAGVFDSDVPAILEVAVTGSQEALAIARQLGDRRLEIIAMLEQARACALLERFDQAAQLAEQCLGLAREEHDVQLLGRSHALLGAARAADQTAALRHHLDAVACFREVGDRVEECTQLMLIAINGWEDEQKVAEGRLAMEMALELAEQLGSTGQLVYLWVNLSLASAILDDYDAAEAYCRRNLRSVRRLGMTRGFLTYDMLVMSHCAAHKGDAAVAAQLAGASDAFWNDVARPTEFTLTPLEVDLIARNKAHLREELGATEFDRLFRAGQQLSIDRAVDLALWKVPGDADFLHAPHEAAQLS